ncbi:hypothetical protein BGZ96_003608 [Linnemannia gamsii]|uniref:Uncharacterized protein n=1 Tax=Linnemannia gamsii TaxID=64522 RepID=A0ABQ7K887_9FUNG|nr:hypothetical protein BGZ96_003608 [Linnemannia gamsii]
MSEPTQPQQQEPRSGPRTLRNYIRESFRNLDLLEGQQRDYIEAYLTTPPGSAPSNTTNNNISPTFLSRGNDLERRNLLDFRRTYHASLTNLRDLIVQLPEDQVVARKRYLRHLLVRIDRMLDRMNIELKKSKAAAAAIGDAGPAEAGAFVSVGDREKRRRVHEGRGGVDGGGNHFQVILTMHQDLMTRLTCLFNELSNKY